jgi:hypothetical protein
MKRTKKMLAAAIVTIMAITAAMATPALAASANCPLSNLAADATAGSACPTSSLLQQMLGSGDPTSIFSNGDYSGLLQQLLGTTDATACPHGDCAANDCPNGDCLTSACPSGDCTTGASPTSDGSTGSCPLTGMLSGLLGR